MTLEIITSDALSPIQHGYFTRRGGASSGVYKGLNCGAGSGDQAEIVAINRGRVADAMGVPPSHLRNVHQVHSTQVIKATGPQIGTREKADGLVTNKPGIAIAALSADCQPVLFADPKSAVIGATHAGWKGALNGVLEATIDAMVELGANSQDIIAVIGPSISQKAYEVGPEFFDVFYEQDAENARFFANGNGDRYLFDLPGYSLNRLRLAGVGHAEWTSHCTYSDPDRFYSYRRSVHKKEADYGRLISCIRL